MPKAGDQIGELIPVQVGQVEIKQQVEAFVALGCGYLL